MQIEYTRLIFTMLYESVLGIYLYHFLTSLKKYNYLVLASFLNKKLTLKLNKVYIKSTRLSSSNQ